MKQTKKNKPPKKKLPQQIRTLGIKGFFLKCSRIIKTQSFKCYKRLCTLHLTLFRDRRCNYMAWSMTWSHVQQSSKGALNHPLVSQSPLNSCWGALPPLAAAFPCYKIQKPVQWQGRTATLHIPPLPGAEEHRTCPMHSPPHRAHHTLTIWEFCWGRFLGWFTASSDRNINFQSS